jgi:predicted methyltransferase
VKRGARFTLALALLASSPGCSVLGRIDLGRVITSGRDGWQHPDRVVEALSVEPGDRVAEIGAGDGYWIRRLSLAVGEAGRVYAVEVDDEKVEDLEARVAKEGLANVVVVRGSFDDPALPDGGIDLAMTCLTYHHIEHREAYFADLRADLAPGGRVAHLDDRPDVAAPFRWFQSRGHWSDPAEIRAEMNEAGYRRVEVFDFLPLQSFQIFVPEGTAAEPSASAPAQGG